MHFILNINFTKLFLTLFFGFLFFKGSTQHCGCTDPTAKNFDVAASCNDGSCKYKKTFGRLHKVARLPHMLVECSGIIFWRHLFWMHNDSGNDPIVYGYDCQSKKISTTIELEKNNDWEEITQDSASFYIGDFGNNAGNRKDLQILKIPKKLISDSRDITIRPEILKFSYPNQVDFHPFYMNHNFDCEAFFCFKDSLYLFSKNWQDHKTRVYKLPKDTGTFSALLYDSFDVDGLITGADISPDNQKVILIGYKNFKPFIWLLFDFKSDHFFSGNKRRISFPFRFGNQTEGICFTDDEHVFISSEKSKLYRNKIFQLNTNKWTKKWLKNKLLQKTY